MLYDMFYNSFYFYSHAENNKIFLRLSVPFFCYCAFFVSAYILVYSWCTVYTSNYLKS